ncbi:TRAP transporter small permease subunit [Bosea sp. 685]|uniref:TRAP transporter small permease subunit n=1 Tax=Bosea sp. 685 TaxID=3080057 RepID=UPI002892BE25|nr:TRAP transporter small permease subunit [Bosea sp. 685]WNJ88182.1 TRAP transporter small permease subunit [Bosea sp. 685]
MAQFVAAIDRLIQASVDAARWLALPLVAILFLQWPLRDLVKAWSREANDLGQCLFALYVAVAVTAATRAGRHLAADTLAHHFAPRTRACLGRALGLLALAPWAVFILVTGFSALLGTLAQLEAFPDTSNPGYFLVKASASLLALLVLLQAIADILRGDAPASGAQEP